MNSGEQRKYFSPTLYIDMALGVSEQPKSTYTSNKIDICNTL